MDKHIEDFSLTPRARTTSSRIRSPTTRRQFVTVSPFLAENTRGRGWSRTRVLSGLFVLCVLGTLFFLARGNWFYTPPGNAGANIVASPTIGQNRHQSSVPTPTATPRRLPTATPAAKLPAELVVAEYVPLVSGMNHSSVIMVSISKQALTAYRNGRVVFNSLVTTGMPDLYTPQGLYSIFNKITNTTFYSSWGPDSPYYYTPEHVNYALQITASGIYLHDATWRSVFGPGTQYPHDDPQYGQMTGSHGCVNLPLDSARWLYNWAPIGTVVDIVA